MDTALLYFWPCSVIVLGGVLCACILYIMRVREKKLKEKQTFSKLSRELYGFPLSNPNPVIGVDHLGYIQFANHGAEVLLSELQHGLHERVPKDWREIIKQVMVTKKPQTTEIFVNTRSYMLTIVPFRRDKLFLFGMEVTQFKNLEKELLNKKTIDDETNLPNRISFNNELEETTRQAKKEGQKFSVLFITIGDYNNLVYTFGQDLARDILVVFSKRLQSTMLAENSLARINENAFAIIERKPTNASALASYVEQLLEETTVPIEIADRKIKISISVGIAMYPGDGNTAEKLERNALLAVNRTTETNNQYEFYQRGMEEQIQLKRDIIADLHLAIDNNQLELYYQPQINIKDYSLMGCEALIRWKHPQKGYISPFFFIPAAEEGNLIVPIGEWVLVEACRQIAKWREMGLKPFKISVNLSAHQILTGNTLDKIKKLKEEYQITPNWLGFELTESALVEDQEKAIKVMQQIKDLGFEIALDDFGTGFSSLSYLLQFPIDKLKIDRSFVKIVEDAQGDYAVTKSIIELAHRMKLSIIVEGVETQPQLEYFQKNQCHSIQGYIFSKPQPASRFSQLVTRDWSDALSQP